MSRRPPDPRRASPAASYLLALARLCEFPIPRPTEAVREGTPDPCFLFLYRGRNVMVTAARPGGFAWEAWEDDREEQGRSGRVAPGTRSGPGEDLDEFRGLMAWLVGREEAERP